MIGLSYLDFVLQLWNMTNEDQLIVNSILEFICIDNVLLDLTRDSRYKMLKLQSVIKTCLIKYYHFKGFCVSCSLDANLLAKIIKKKPPDITIDDLTAYCKQNITNNINNNDNNDADQFGEYLQSLNYKSQEFDGHGQVEYGYETKGNINIAQKLQRIKFKLNFGKCTCQLFDKNKNKSNKGKLQTQDETNNINIYSRSKWLLEQMTKIPDPKDNDHDKNSNILSFKSKFQLSFKINHIG